MFVGALLLLAAVLTWFIGLTLSPYGQTVVDGTDHIRDSVVTFKRNSALGTLILTALAGWLLFPRRRANWPLRDGALIVLLALLAGSSLYTLLSLRLSPSAPAYQANFTTRGIGGEANDATITGANPQVMNAPPPDVTVSIPASPGPVTMQRNERTADQAQADVPDVTEEQTNTQPAVDAPKDGDAENETDQNSD